MAYLEPKASSKACRTCKMIMHIQNLGIVRTVHLSIFKGIDAYSATLAGVKIGRERGALPALFENQKRWPDFGKIGFDCVHLCGKFLIQNVVLRVSRRKGSLFSCAFDKMFIKVP